jgi:hypothetical protein
MTAKIIKLTARCGSTAHFRASTSKGCSWSVSRISYGIFTNGYDHVGDAGNLDDAVNVAKASWDLTASKVSIS